jgi:tRNA nucleotidyltransferase (CCA-adding enzyme)
MVRMQMAVKPDENLSEALQSAYSELDAVGAATDAPVYLVGGAVRDLLLGRGRSDVDLVVVGDAAALASKLGAEPVEHERFATAKVKLDGHEVDIATARAESYPRPGALPEVEPAADIETDLGRRDFTINAMAIPLQGEPRLIDPHGGRADLEAGRLRILHAGSFADDPTRALRAARYAARFGFAPEPETEALLPAADLTTVSADRRQTGLLRLAAEPEAARGFELLTEWGLVEPRPEGVELVRRVVELLAAPPWDEVAPCPQVVLAAALGAPGGEAALAAARPARPSEAVELARRCKPVELVLARALGAEWLDRYLLEWRSVELEIDGDDLVAAGVPQGPAVGEGLAEALRRRLDGEISGREAELETALAAARAGER